MVTQTTKRNAPEQRVHSLTRKRIRSTVRAVFDSNVPVIRWWRALPNWGDALNPVLVRHISGREPVCVDEIINVANRTVYSVIGSVLDNAWFNNMEVWGSGFMRDGARMAKAPRRVHAVRGPLTRESLRRLGIPCPDIYGDPALLFPRYYHPRVEQKYDLGVIPHYVDQDHPSVRALRETPGVHVINVLAGVNEFVDELLSCRAIASSSLHGLIAADAYGIPSTWIRLSDGVTGGDFKFRDYFLGVHRPVEQPLEVGPTTGIDRIFDRFSPYQIDIDLERLLAACPFRSLA